MADKLQSTTILSQGGWDSTENHLWLDANLPGGASRLLNYEVGFYGGYRRLSGFEPFDANYEFVDDTNAKNQILVTAVYRDIDETETLFVAREQKVGGVYKFYKYDAGLGWVAVATGLTHNMVGDRQVSKLRFHKVTFENTSYIIFVDGVNNPMIFDGTTWYQPTVGGAGTPISPGGDQMLEAPSYVTSFKNHVFFSGDFDYPAVVFHSAPENPLDFTVASGAGQLATGFPVKQIRPFRENLFVFGKMRIKKIVVDNTTFTINDVANNIGTISPDSVIEINGDILFLAQDGVRTVSGTDKIGDINLGSLSKQVQQFLNNLQSNYDLELLNSVVIRGKSQFRYFVSSTATDDPGSGLIGGLRSMNAQTWEFSELLGIATSCTESDYWADLEVILHGSYTGGVYKQESGRTFNGTAITSIYSTPFLTLGDVLKNKLAQRIRTFYRPEGSLTIGIKLDYDWNDPEILSPSQYSEDSTLSVALWDSGLLWDGGTLWADGSDLFPVLETTVQGSFKSVKITYTTSGDYEPHSIQGFVIDFMAEDTRGPGGSV